MRLILFITVNQKLFDKYVIYLYMSWDDGTHLLRQAAPPGPAGPPGLPGEKGDDVLGFYLTSDGNYDLQNKRELLSGHSR